LLGTREFVVLHHTDCGMTMFTDDVLRDKMHEGTGRDASDWEFLSFPDLDLSVRDDVQRIRGIGLLPDGVTVGGYVYDVRTGTIREVVAPTAAAA
jgi:carbonic anhydrase